MKGSDEFDAARIATTPDGEFFTELILRNRLGAFNRQFPAVRTLNGDASPPWGRRMAFSWPLFRRLNTANRSNGDDLRI
jgi:hypothetical protein